MKALTQNLKKYYTDLLAKIKKSIFVNGSI